MLILIAMPANDAAFASDEIRSCLQKPNFFNAPCIVQTNEGLPVALENGEIFHSENGEGIDSLPGMDKASSIFFVFTLAKLIENETYDTEGIRNFIIEMVVKRFPGTFMEMLDNIEKIHTDGTSITVRFQDNTEKRFFKDIYAAQYGNDIQTGKILKLKSGTVIMMTEVPKTDKNKPSLMSSGLETYELTRRDRAIPLHVVKGLLNQDEEGHTAYDTFRWELSPEHPGYSYCKLALNDVQKDELARAFEGEDIYNPDIIIIRYKDTPIAVCIVEKDLDAKVLNLCGYFDIDSSRLEIISLKIKDILLSEKIIIRSNNALVRNLSNEYANFVVDEDGFLLGTYDESTRDDYPTSLSGHRNIRLPILPGVYPGLSEATVMSSRAVYEFVKPGSKVLVIGSGIGIEAMLAREAGGLVDAVDISSMAVENTKLASNFSESDNRPVDAFKNDIFKDLGRYDLIIFNMPHVSAYGLFPDGKIIRPDEMATLDSGGMLLGRIAREITGHMEMGAVAVIINTNESEMKVKATLKSYSRLNVDTGTFGVEADFSKAYILSHQVITDFRYRNKGGLTRDQKRALMPEFKGFPGDLKNAFAEFDQKDIKITTRMFHEYIYPDDEDQRTSIGGVLTQNISAAEITKLIKIHKNRTAVKAILVIIRHLFLNADKIGKLEKKRINALKMFVMDSMWSDFNDLRLHGIRVLQCMVEAGVDFDEIETQLIFKCGNNNIRENNHALKEASIDLLVSIYVLNAPEISPGPSIVNRNSANEYYNRRIALNLKGYLKTAAGQASFEKCLDHILNECAAKTGLGFSAYISSRYFRIFAGTLFVDTDKLLHYVDNAIASRYSLTSEFKRDVLDVMISCIRGEYKGAEKEDIDAIIKRLPVNEPVVVDGFYDDEFIQMSVKSASRELRNETIFYDAEQGIFLTNPLIVDFEFEDEGGKKKSFWKDLYDDEDGFLDFGNPLTWITSVVAFFIVLLPTPVLQYGLPLLAIVAAGVLSVILGFRIVKKLRSSNIARRFFRWARKWIYERRLKVGLSGAALLFASVLEKNFFLYSPAIYRISIVLLSISIIAIAVLSHKYQPQDDDDNDKSDGRNNVSFGSGVGLRHDKANNIVSCHPKIMLKKGRSYYSKGYESPELETPSEADVLRLDNAMNILRNKAKKDRDENLLDRINSFTANTTVILSDTPTYLLIGGYGSGKSPYYQLTHVGMERRVIYFSKKGFEAFDPNNKKDMRQLATIINHDQFEINYMNRPIFNDLIKTPELKEKLIEKAHYEALNEDPFKMMKRLEKRLTGWIKKDRGVSLINEEIERLEEEYSYRRKLLVNVESNLPELAEYAYNTGQLALRIAHAYEYTENNEKAREYFEKAIIDFIEVQSTDTFAKPVWAQLKIISIIIKEGDYEGAVDELKRLLNGGIGGSLSRDKGDEMSVAIEFFLRPKIKVWLNEFSHLIIENIANSKGDEALIRGFKAIEDMSDAVFDFLKTEMCVKPDIAKSEVEHPFFDDPVIRIRNNNAYRFDIGQRVWGKWEIFLSKDMESLYITPGVEEAQKIIESNDYSKVEFFVLRLTDLKLSFHSIFRELDMEGVIPAANSLRRYTLDMARIIGIIKEAVAMREEVIKHPTMRYFWVDQYWDKGAHLVSYDILAKHDKPKLLEFIGYHNNICDFYGTDGKGRLALLAEFGFHSPNVLGRKLSTVFKHITNSPYGDKKGTGRNMKIRDSIILSVSMSYKKSHKDKTGQVSNTVFKRQAEKLVVEFLRRLRRGKEVSITLPSTITVEDTRQNLKIMFEIKDGYIDREADHHPVRHIKKIVAMTIKQVMQRSQIILNMKAREVRDASKKDEEEKKGSGKRRGPPEGRLIRKGTILKSLLFVPLIPRFSEGAVEFYFSPELLLFFMVVLLAASIFNAAGNDDEGPQPKSPPKTGDEPLKIKAYGGVDGPGKSAFLFKTGGKTVLLDCGLSPSTNRGPDLSGVENIDFILVSHAHLDHSGYLPDALKQFPEARVITTEPTLEMVRVLLSDSLRFRPSYLPPIYRKDIKRVFDNAVTVEMENWYEISDDIKIRFTPAGHILGACMITIATKEGTIIYSGDISVEEQTHLQGVKTPQGETDMLIAEALYGDRRREKDRSNVVDEFAQKINDTIDRGGSVLVPAFAMGRSTEIALMLKDLQKKEIIPNIPIFIDGMAGAMVKIFEHYKDQVLPDSMRHLIDEGGTILSGENTNIQIVPRGMRDKVLNMEEPHIIIAGSGMLSGGSAVKYFKKMAGNPKNSVFLVGYLAEQTVGRKILSMKRGDRISVEDQEIHVNAEIDRFSFTAHAYQQDLLSFIGEIGPKALMLIHAGKRAKEFLMDEMLKMNPGLKISLPGVGNEIVVPASDRTQEFNNIEATELPQPIIRAKITAKKIAKQVRKKKEKPPEKTFDQKADEFVRYFLVEIFGEEANANNMFMMRTILRVRFGNRLPSFRSYLGSALGYPSDKDDAARVKNECVKMFMDIVREGHVKDMTLLEKEPEEPVWAAETSKPAAKPEPDKDKPADRKTVKPKKTDQEKADEYIKYFITDIFKMEITDETLNIMYTVFYEHFDGKLVRFRTRLGSILGYPYGEEDAKRLYQEILKMYAYIMDKKAYLTGDAELLKEELWGYWGDIFTEKVWGPKREFVLNLIKPAEQKINSLSRQCASRPKKRGPETLILYADDILNDAVFFDLDHVMGKMVQDGGILENGKIVFYVKDENLLERTEKLKAYIEAISKNKTDVIIITKKNSPLEGIDSADYGKEANKLVEYAKAKGIDEESILAIVKSHKGKLIEDKYEKKIPFVLLNLEGINMDQKGVFSFAEIIIEAIRKLRARKHFITILDPVSVINIEGMYQEYLRYIEAVITKA